MVFSCSSFGLLLLPDLQGELEEERLLLVEVFGRNDSDGIAPLEGLGETDKYFGNGLGDLTPGKIRGIRKIRSSCFGTVFSTIKKSKGSPESG